MNIFCNFKASSDLFLIKYKDQFDLPTLSRRLADLRKTLVDGQGFWLFKNLPVKDWGLHKSATAYMGLGTHLGYFLSQNGRGHILGHVKDLQEDSNQTHQVRIYRTNARYVDMEPLVTSISSDMS